MNFTKTITAAALFAVVAMSGCSSASIQQNEAEQIARAEACQQSGGSLKWQGGIKRCVANDLFAQHPTNAIVLTPAQKTNGPRLRN